MFLYFSSYKCSSCICFVCLRSLRQIDKCQISILVKLSLYYIIIIMAAKAKTVKRRSISSASRIDVMASLSILGFWPLPLSSLCRLKTNARVRYSCYAVMCIILNVSVSVFLISELNLIIALTSALFHDVVKRIILLSAVVRK